MLMANYERHAENQRENKRMHAYRAITPPLLP